jgi:hypothetical protein
MDSNIRIIERMILLLEKGWCRESFAKDNSGKEVRHNSPNATSFCVWGALNRAQFDLNLPYNKVIFSYLSDKIGNLISYNDNARDKRTIIRKLKKIVKEAKEEQNALVQ